MSDEIAVISPKSFDEAGSYAKALAAATVIGGKLHGKPADVLAIILAGAELGLPPMQSIRGIHLVDGKPCLDSALAVALVKRSLKAGEYIRMVESSDKLATYEAKRAEDPGPTRLSFTIEEANRAGLTGKDNWKKYPAAMLRARAAMALVRVVFPEVTFGVYDPDELNVADASASSSKVERDITPPPPQATQTRTEEVKAKLASKATASRVKIVDVVEADVAPKPSPPAQPARDERHPNVKQLEELAAKYEWDVKQLGVLAKGTTGKAKSSEMTPEDFAKLEAACIALSARHAEDAAANPL